MIRIKKIGEDPTRLDSTPSPNNQASSRRSAFVDDRPAGRAGWKGRRAASCGDRCSSHLVALSAPRLEWDAPRCPCGARLGSRERRLRIQPATGQGGGGAL